MKIRKGLIGVMTAVLMGAATAWCGSGRGFTIVINSSVTVTQLNFKTLQSIFLGEKAQWGNGDKIIPVTLEEGSVHDLFLKDVLHKTAIQYSNFWNQQLFTGKGIPPRSFLDVADVVDFVSRTRGAIGYVPAGADAGLVKTVEITE